MNHPRFHAGEKKVLQAAGARRVNCSLSASSNPAFLSIVTFTSEYYNVLHFICYRMLSIRLMWLKVRPLNSRNYYVMGSTHGNPVNHRDWVIILLKSIYKNCQTSELILRSRQVFLVCCPPLWWKGAVRSMLLCDLKTAFWQPAFIPTSFCATLCVIQNRITETTFPKHLCLQGSGCDFTSASVFMWDFIGGRKK